MSPNRSTAVMQRRYEAVDSLDFFPTPPWATRALMEAVPAMRAEWEGLGGIVGLDAWEPAAGEGHMAEVLGEYFHRVHASDVHDYGRGYALGSFTGEGLDRATCPFRPDWVISNPPFNLAEDFVRRALGEASRGVALLLRSAWLESDLRYSGVFRDMPPSTVAVFVERVAMVKGRWDPTAASATAYAWFIWKQPLGVDTRLVWIPPGQKRRLTRPDDVRRFTSAAAPGPLFSDAS